MNRVLLGQLGSNGDCLYATTLARQIKTDYPGCHLTWAVSDLCRSAIEHNPDVDDLWVVPLPGWAAMADTWRSFEHDAHARVARGDFDRAFLTQIYPANFAKYDGTVRPSLFRNYPGPITVPVETAIHVSDEERQYVEDWIVQNRIRSFDQTVVFECSSKSGQSFVTPALATEVAERVLARNPNACFILSTHEDVPTSRSIISGKALNLRQTAFLTHDADLFVGCGSGVTVVATSAAAKPELPNIQVLKGSASVFGSFRHDFEYFGKPSSHFIETTSESAASLVDIVESVLRDGVHEARTRHHRPVDVTFGHYLATLTEMQLRHDKYIDAAESLLITSNRYGWTDELLAFAHRSVAPNIDDDELIIVPRGEEIRARFLSEIGTPPATVTSAAPAAAEPVENSRPLPSLIAAIPAQTATSFIAACRDALAAFRARLRRIA
jgi:hypothetical protein